MIGGPSQGPGRFCWPRKPRKSWAPLAKWSVNLASCNDASLLYKGSIIPMGTCFLPIDLDRSVLASRIFKRRYDLAGIFNWVFNMIDAAARSTSPTKPGAERDSEIQGF